MKKDRKPHRRAKKKRTISKPISNSQESAESQVGPEPGGGGGGGK